MNPQSDRSNLFLEFGILAVETVFLVVLFSWFKTLISATELIWVPPDYANFAIHEGGHFLFGFLGEFIGVLGGSIFQVLLPILIMIYFFFRKNHFSALFCLFWAGENLVNVKFYIEDASCMCLPITGDIHDWNFILSRLNMLSYDTFISKIVFIVGVIVMALALLLMASNIVREVAKKVIIAKKSMS
jgi:hypothetical protein